MSGLPAQPRESVFEAELAASRQACQQIEQRYRSLLASAFELTWTMNATAELHDESNQFCDLTGFTADELNRCGWWEAMHADDRSPARAAWALAVLSGNAFEMEYRLRTKQGDYRHFRSRAVPVAEQHESPREWICTANDITLAKRAEAARVQLAAIVESSDDAIFSVNLENVICSWNKGAEKLFGFTADEMVGSALTLLMPGTSRDLELDTQCVSSGVSIKNYDVVRRRKDGTLITVSLTVSPTRDASGRIIGVSKIGRDITERRRAEEVLLRQANLLDRACEPMIAWTLNGSIVYWNQGAEELYGFSRGEAVSCIIHQLLHSVYPVALDSVMQQLENEHLWGGEMEHTTKTGKMMTVESRQNLIYLSNSEALVLQSDRDVSKRKRTEAALRQLNEELERCVEQRTHELAETNRELEAFSNSVAHDLRAPLRSLKGFSRILLMDYAGKALDDRALDLMHRMSAAAARMGQFIEDLLQLSRVSRSELSLLTVDVTKLAALVVKKLRARNPDQEVEVQIEPGIAARADARLLRLALENLLENAWKFTGRTASRRIEVTLLRDSGQEPVYCIRDNGAGFNMAYADQLFAPFQRLHRRTEFEGTGIGLATVQRVIHRHGGRIWAEGSLGKGAAFYFTLGRRDKYAREPDFAG